MPRAAIERLARYAGALIALAAIAGCGQSGPLFLPRDSGARHDDAAARSLGRPPTHPAGAATESRPAASPGAVPVRPEPGGGPASSAGGRAGGAPGGNGTAAH